VSVEGILYMLGSGKSGLLAVGCSVLAVVRRHEYT